MRSPSQTAIWMRSPVRSAALLLLWFPSLACSSNEDAAGSASCDPSCADQIALRAFRETLKLVYNLTLQGNAVGVQDESVSCPSGGAARLTGVANSSPTQGATEVDLTYALDRCAYLRREAERTQNYALEFSGTVLQIGVIAVQPSTTTALVIRAESLAIDGAVYDPPIPFHEPVCAAELGQDGSLISGMFCGRVAGVDL